MTEAEAQRGKRSAEVRGPLRTTAAVVFVVAVALFWVLPIGAAWVQFNIRWWANSTLSDWIRIGIGVVTVGVAILITSSRRERSGGDVDTQRSPDDAERSHLH